MKVKCISDNTFSISLTYGKIYEVIGIENGWYRIVDNTEEDYLFSPEYYAVKAPGLTRRQTRSFESFVNSIGFQTRSQASASSTFTISSSLNQ